MGTRLGVFDSAVAWAGGLRLSLPSRPFVHNYPRLAASLGNTKGTRCVLASGGSSRQTCCRLSQREGQGRFLKGRWEVVAQEEARPGGRIVSSAWQGPGALRDRQVEGLGTKEGFRHWPRC